mgnify:CR=1 FL=1
MDTENLIVSTKSLCAFFGVTDRTVRRWKASGCPSHAFNQWNLKEVQQWKDEFISTPAKPAATTEELRARKLQADTEYREERAQRERLLREVLEDMYYKKTDVEEAWSQRALEAKTAFLMFEKTLPVELYGKSIEEMETIIASRVREVLANYARTGSKYTQESDTAQTA